MDYRLDLLEEQVRHLSCLNASQETYLNIMFILNVCTFLLVVCLGFFERKPSVIIYERTAQPLDKLVSV